MLAPARPGGARSTTRSPSWPRAASPVARVEGALRAPARSRARALREAAAPRLRHRAAPPSGGRARRNAHRADRRRPEERNGNGNGHDEPGTRRTSRRRARPQLEAEVETSSPRSRCRPRTAGRVRRYRFRHPTASGKTIAAAGFVEAARTEGVLILTHRRLLVDQFRRELTEHGYGDRLHDAILTGHTAPRPSNPITIQTYAWFARHVDEIAARRVPARDLRRGAHGARREDLGRDPLAATSRSTSA